MAAPLSGINEMFTVRPYAFGMSYAAPCNPFESFLLLFAALIGRMSRYVDDRRHRAEHARPVFEAVLDRLDRMFLCVQRAVERYELGRPTRAPSAACHAAAAAARAARDAAQSDSGEQAETAPRRTRGWGFRLPQGFGWLPRLLPEAEGFRTQLRDVLNDPVLIELLAKEPKVRRTLRSLCNMLGLGNFIVKPAQEAALGRYVAGRGWRVRDVPAAPSAAETALDIAEVAGPVPAAARRQNE